MNRIKSWMRSFGSKMESWMYGRYGQDALSVALSVTALILLVTGMFTGFGWCSGLGLAVWILMLFRTYSRNIAARRRELESYMKLTAPIRRWVSLTRRKWRDRKTHRYVKCAQCKYILRVPRGKGKIKIHCPKCGGETIRKT